MHLFHPIWLEVAVVLLGLGLLMAEAFAERMDKKFFAYAGAAGLGLVFFASFLADGASTATALADATSIPSVGYTAFYSPDALAMFFKRFALVTTMIVLVMSVEYLPVLRRFTPGATAQGGLGEFFSLPIFTCAGLMWMVSAVDFVMIFVSLELVTISFYILVSYTRRNAVSLEAGVKYLILGALSTGFLVYGITWMFGLTGETNLARIGVALGRLDLAANSAPVLFAFTLVLIALGFKVAAAPFQIWVPDVYQGAPTPVTAFLSVGSKAAGFVVLLRVLEPFFAQPALAPKITLVVAIIAAATLIYGNFAALPQNNFKRLLAYSSIAHAGYLLMAVASLGGAARSSDGTTPSVAATLTGGFLSPNAAVAFYLAGYLLMTLLAFTITVVVANHTGGDDIAHFNGLARRSPFLAFGMLIATLSLAGLPLTVGGFGKFFIFAVTLEPHLRALNWLTAIGAITVACGFYYYLKVIRAMYFQPPPEGREGIVDAPAIIDLTVSTLAVLIVVLGIWPQPALELLHEHRQPEVVAVGK